MSSTTLSCTAVAFVRCQGSWLPYQQPCTAHANTAHGGHVVGMRAMGCSDMHADPVRALLIVLFRQLGPIVRSPAAASGGGGGQGLLISLLEAFIEAHQADVQRCLSQGVSPATGAV